MSIISCHIDKMEALNPTVMRVVLNPETPLMFQPGQYLQVIMSEQDRRPFSIANAVREDGMLELHIGSAKSNPYATEVLQLMQKQDIIRVVAPCGKSYFKTTLRKPIILVAGGTGFSYTRSILQHILQHPTGEPVFLYWGTRSMTDMYEYEALSTLDKQHRDFTFVPVLEIPPKDWQGKVGWVHFAVKDDFVSLEPYCVYIAGRFEMAGVAREDFHQQGLLLEHLFGDAYEFI